MDFFGAQAKARRNSFWLTLGLVLATLSISVFLYSFFHILRLPEKAIIIFMVFGVCSLFFYGSRFADASLICTFFIFFAVLMWFVPKNEFLDISVLGRTTTMVMGIVAFGSFYKIQQIASQGMGKIIRDLGAVQIARNTRNLAEKRLLHVVDEISIAASIIPPKVFLLGREKSINAFAGGLNDRDNTIVVTRGALEKLSRDELQAVIAHETSHIVNGDARFNLKLIGLLHGVTILSYPVSLLARFIRDRERILAWVLAVIVVMGYGFLQGNNGFLHGIYMFGLFFLLVALYALFAVPIYIPNAIGALFARLIKAAISREREFLADAAAVQYTRNPDALARALAKIEQFGSKIHIPGAEVVSHMFFGNCRQDLSALLERWFATHPDISERIERLSVSLQRPSDSRASKDTSKDAPAVDTVATSSLQAQRGNPSASKNTPAAIASLPLASAQNLMAALPQSLFAAIGTSVGAKAAAYALFISAHEDVQAQQLETLRKTHTSALAKASLNRAHWLFAHDRRYRLLLLDLALPALRELALSDRLRLLECIDALTRANNRLSASGFALKHILRHTLAPAPARSRLRLEQMDADIAILLALLAYAGNNDKDSVCAAYRRARDISPMRRALPLPEKQALRSQAVEAALSHLGQATQAFRARFLQACVAAVEHDGQITATESEMLRAFAQSLDCPVQQCSLASGDGGRE